MVRMQKLTVVCFAIHLPISQYLTIHTKKKINPGLDLFGETAF